MKAITWLAAIATLVGSAIYMIVSLNRWEWNRALFFGLILLIAEVAIATGLVLRRLTQMGSDMVDPNVRSILRETRPRSPDRFAWLERSATRMPVFITFLVGGGVVLSGMAWVVDKVASHTATPAGEEHLARQLGSIRYPRGGLLVDDVTVLAQDVPGAADAQIRKLLHRGGFGA